ncbi:carboxymuconolactone decarboxylase family protein [Yunchengibacter salinarum]|uniref:carboxymuconolactone decarboxylase family protein n=1 Tax=Yunchengibacter salinarum TaxID=3133399 RepID=UPI0035B68A82
MDFKLHTKDTAPAGAKDILEGAEKKYGFVPNLLATMAEAPAVVEAYATLGGIFDKTSFSPTERQVVLLTVSRENVCTYCMAAHTVIAGMQDVPDDVVDALRNDTPIQDEKLEALRRYTRAVVESRGNPSDADVKAFFDAGYGNQQVLEVNLGVTFKTLSNYTNHVAHTPVDSAFKSAEWSK